MATPEDGVLIQRAQQGNLEAFDELIRRHGRRVFNLAYRLMGNHADAADASQEALVRFYKRLNNFRGDSAISTWLYKIAVNACLDELRRRNRHRHASLDESCLVNLTRVNPSGEEGPDELAERQEIRQEVQRSLARLRADFRVLIVLRDLQGFSYEEIMTITGQTLGTVKSKLHRARLALRRIILARMRAA